MVQCCYQAIPFYLNLARISHLQDFQLTTECWRVHLRRDPVTHHHYRNVTSLPEYTSTFTTLPNLLK
nr:hypothetical protein Q903MT_gene1748 [Picea sitchensis]